MTTHSAKSDMISPEPRRMAAALSQTGERLGDTLDTINEGARDALEKGKGRVKEWEEGIVVYVKKQPVKSLLIAATVGIVVGMVFRRS